MANKLFNRWAKNEWAKGGKHYNESAVGRGTEYLPDGFLETTESLQEWKENKEKGEDKKDDEKFLIDVPVNESTKNLASLIYAEADDSPFNNKSKTSYTDEMLAIGCVVRNRINWVNLNKFDKDSFCGGTYLSTISCVNKWGETQFSSYNNSKYKRLLTNNIPNEIQQRFAKACIEVAKLVVNGETEKYEEYLGFNQSKSQSPFSKARTKEPPTKIGAHYFWELKS